MDIKSYLLGKQAGGGTPINNQNKDVTITENGTTTVSADAGYTGLGTVGITTNVSGDLSDYFTSTISPGDAYGTAGFIQTIKKIPGPLTPSGTSLYYAFTKYPNAEIPSVIGTENVTNFSYMFSASENITTLNLTTMNTQKATNMEYMFNYCINLETINMNGLNLGKISKCSNMFRMCSKLTNLTFGYDLGKAYSAGASANLPSYTLDLSVCTLLTHDSLMSVINNLYDIATAGVQTQQLILGATNLAKLSQAEIDIATNKGWTVS